MNRSGNIDWHPAQRLHAVSLGLHTYVYAYWLADTEPSRVPDAGLGILKRAGHHPDWFIHASRADRHLSGCADRSVVQVSQSYYDVFGPDGQAGPLLAAVLLGTASFALEGWACGREDLTRVGQNLLRRLDQLYLRPGVIVTFQQTAADETVGPRGSHDPATVQLPRG